MNQAAAASALSGPGASRAVSCSCYCVLLIASGSRERLPQRSPACLAGASCFLPPGLAELPASPNRASSGRWLAAVASREGAGPFADLDSLDL